MSRPVARAVWTVLVCLVGVVSAVVVATAFWPDAGDFGTGRTPAPAGSSDAIVIAHRGASAYAPHNTVAAAREAVARGADVLETDLRQTRDGHLVALFHATLAPTTNVEEVFPHRRPWRVESFTLAEVRRLDAGSWFGPEHAGERVPTLAQLADAVDGSGLQLMVEVKSPRRYPGIADRVLRAVRGRPGLYREMESFDWQFVRRFARFSPPVRLGLAGTPPARRLDEVATYADAVNPALGSIDDTYVDRAHDLGLEVKVWSLNERPPVRHAVAIGVDGIYSHRPDMVREVLGR